MNEFNLQAFENIIEEFNKLPKVAQSRRTFLDVSGYPHYENVVSNILAFFFDTSESHNLDDLFLKSLLETIDNNELEVSEIKTDIATEYSTAKGNRIDILIETNVFDVIIENKIFATLDNDLKDYYQTIYNKNEKDGDKKTIPIVLSLKPTDQSKIDKKKQCDEFKHITYSDFFTSINRNLGEHISCADSEWLIYLKNFMNEITNRHCKVKMKN